MPTNGSKTSFLTGRAGWLLGLLLIGGAWFGAWTEEYAHTDDYPYWLFYQSGWVHPLDSAITEMGRPLSSVLTWVGFTLAHDLADLRWLRLVGVLGAMAFFLGLAGVLRRAGWRPEAAWLAAVLTCLTPSFAVYAGWASCAPLYPWAALLALLSGETYFRARRERRPGARWWPTLGLWATLCIYQPLAGFFVLSAMAWAEPRRLGRGPAWAWARTIGFVVIHMALYFVAYKLLTDWFVEATWTRERGELNLDPRVLVPFLLTDPLPSGLTFWAVFHDWALKLLVGAVVVWLAGTAILARRERREPARGGYELLVVLTLGLSLGPVMLSSETSAPFRTLGAFYAVILLLVVSGLARLGWERLLSRRRRQEVWTGGAIALATLTAVLAGWHLYAGLIHVQQREQAAFAAYVERTFATYPEAVVFVHPWERGPGTPFAPRHEFGAWSSNLPWVPFPLLVATLYDKFGYTLAQRPQLTDPLEVILVDPWQERRDTGLALIEGSEVLTGAPPPPPELLAAPEGADTGWRDDPLWGTLWELSDDWRFSPWFGYFRPIDASYVHHANLGMLNVQPTADGNGLAFFREELGWCWTTSEHFPAVFVGEQGNWFQLHFEGWQAFARIPLHAIETELAPPPRDWTFATPEENPILGPIAKDLSGWARSPWLGVFHLGAWPYIMHEDLGLLHVARRDAASGEVWLRSDPWGWLATSPELYPTVFHVDGGEWRRVVHRAEGEVELVNEAEAEAALAPPPEDFDRDGPREKQTPWGEVRVLDDGWKWSPWFGLFNDELAPLLVHAQWGTFRQRAASPEATLRDEHSALIWLWHEDAGWFWTTPAGFPKVHADGREQLLFRRADGTTGLVDPRAPLTALPPVPDNMSTAMESAHPFWGEARRDATGWWRSDRWGHFYPITPAASVHAQWGFIEHVERSGEELWFVPIDGETLWSTPELFPDALSPATETVWRAGRDDAGTLYWLDTASLGASLPPVPTTSAADATGVTHPRLGEATSLGAGWWSVEGFGRVNDLAFPLLWHEDLGALRWSSGEERVGAEGRANVAAGRTAGTAADDGYFLYRDDVGWFWTSRTLFPVAILARDGSAVRFRAEPYAAAPGPWIAISETVPGRMLPAAPMDDAPAIGEPVDHAVFGTLDRLGEGWLRSDWFGLVQVWHDPAVVHPQLGLLRLREGEGELVWLHTETTGWVWTGPEAWPRAQNAATGETWQLLPPSGTAGPWLCLDDPWRTLPPLPADESEAIVSTDESEPRLGPVAVTASGWRRSPWLGWFYPGVAPNVWVHGELGILETRPPTDAGLWFRADGVGWCWTSRESWPLVYRDATGAWVELVWTAEKGLQARAPSEEG